MKLLTLFSTLLAVFSLPTARGQACGWEGPYRYDRGVNETHPVDIPIGSARAFNVVSVHFKGVLLRAKLKGTTDYQVLDIYITEAFNNFWDLQMVTYFDESMYFRCVDGTIIEDRLGVSSIAYQNNRAPEFDSDSYTLQVTLPWPIEIPITVGYNIFVSDLDYIEEHTQVEVSSSTTDLVRVTTSALVKQGPSTDFKVELFAKPALTPGTHAILLTATDEKNTVNCAVTLIVTDTGRSHLQDPVFENKTERSTAPIFYKAEVNFLPNRNDILNLDGGVKVEAYDPDELCRINFSVNADFLEIMPTGYIVFTCELSVAEIRAMSPSTIVEIRAVEEIRGKFTRIPLFLSIILR